MLADNVNISGSGSGRKHSLTPIIFVGDNPLAMPQMALD